MGRKNLGQVDFLSPRPGLAGFDDLTNGFTVGYFLPRRRRLKQKKP